MLGACPVGMGSQVGGRTDAWSQVAGSRPAWPWHPPASRPGSLVAPSHQAGPAMASGAELGRGCGTN